MVPLTTPPVTTYIPGCDRPNIDIITVLDSNNSAVITAVTSRPRLYYNSSNKLLP